MYLRDVHSAKPTAASVSNAAKSLRILRRLREIISQRGVKVTFKVRANADAEPLGRWPQGKAMKASVATATRYDSVACDEGRFIFPEECASAPLVYLPQGVSS